jgi:hypothetical protein
MGGCRPLVFGAEIQGGSSLGRRSSTSLGRGTETDEPLWAFGSGRAERINAAVLPQVATDAPWPVGKPVFGLVVRSRVAATVHGRPRGSGPQIRPQPLEPVVIASVDGSSYLGSMLGPGSDWVKNVEAAHGDAVIRQGRRRRVHLVAVPPEQRAPVLREYVRIASSGRQHFPLPVGAPLSDFEEIAGRYPVYRIDPS